MTKTFEFGKDPNFDMVKIWVLDLYATKKLFKKRKNPSTLNNELKST